jgi:D-alanine-D-alanine ligase
VESYLPGREFSVALLEYMDSDKLLAMPVELITEPNAQGDSILGQTVKSEDTEHVVAVTDLALRGQLSKFAKSVFRALGARDYGRIDIRLDAHGQPQFLEANLIPGLAKHDFVSYFTAACEINQAMSYDVMILELVALCLDRYIAPDEELEIEATMLEPVLI